MTAHTIQQTQQIPQEEWLAFFNQFSQDNRGRLIALEIADQDIDNEDLVKRSPLAFITYDPVTKGNDVVIAIGREAVAYSHTVNCPQAVWVAKDDADQVLALEIVDHSGAQTIVRFGQ